MTVGLALSSFDAAASPAAVYPYGDEFVVNRKRKFAQLLPDVASVGAGKYAVIWQGARSGTDATSVVWVRRVGRSEAVGRQRLVSQRELVGQGSIFPVLAGRPGQTFVGAWVDEDGGDGSSNGIFARDIPVNLVSSGTPFQVNNLVTEFSQAVPAIAMASNGDFLIAWHDQGHPLDAPRSNVKARFYKADGLPEGDEFLIAPTADGEPFAVKLAAVDSTGEYIATWNAGPASQPYDIFARVIGRHEDPPPVFRVNTSTAGTQAHPDVAACEDGSYIVAWHSYENVAEPDLDIYAQWFDADGKKRGPEVIVNQFTTGTQNFATVAATADCQAIIMWQSDVQDGDQSGVYARIFSKDGGPATAEFRLNQATAGRQGSRSYRQTSLIADSNSSFFAAWSSDVRSDDSWDIVGRSFCWLSEGSTAVCGNATCVNDDSPSDGLVSITATDALAALLVASGLTSCPLCRCDTDHSGDVSAADALIILRTSVGQLRPTCPFC